MTIQASAATSIVAEANSRVADHPVSALFLQRWSPRALTGEPIPDDVLFQLFEAARFAPSSYNSQPWRFVYVKRGAPAWPKLFAALSDRNQAWACNASALILVASKPNFTPPGQSEEIASRSHSFDAGAAWASLAFQAALLGWSTHALGGFDIEKAREATAAPKTYHLEAIIAVGKRADKSVLPESLQAIEKPNARRPIADFVFADTFPGEG
jgi:nitroreductase